MAAHAVRLPLLPDFRLPAAATRIGRRLPALPPAIGLAGALNLAVLAGVLPRTEIDTLDGKRFRIAVSDAGMTIGLTVRDGLFLPDGGDLPLPDLIITAPLASFLQLLGRQVDPDTLFFERRLALEGDTELGLQVKNLLDAADFSRLLPPRLAGLVPPAAP